jgi:hypothetical protein
MEGSMRAFARAWCAALVMSGCGGPIPGPDGSTAMDPDASSATDASSAHDASLPVAVLPCDSLVRGTWEAMMPPGTSLDRDFETPAGTNFGMHSIVLDPRNAGVVYLGTSAMGIHKSDDCGATWTHVNTGANAELIDGGRQWTFEIDPEDPQVLYTNTGYGAEGIAWKSTNGGVDWEPLIQTPEVAALQFGNFVSQIVMDPTNPRHLIVTPHFECEIGAVEGRPLQRGCVLESTDAGETWRILEGEGQPTGGEGAGMWMEDADNWFWSSYFGGLHRTTDGGHTWEHLFDERYTTPGHFRTADGTRYVAGIFSTLTSTDGDEWVDLEGGPGSDALIASSEIAFASRNGHYHFAMVSDLSTWTELPRPPFPYPENVVTWHLAYDEEHRVLYSINSINGAWRYAMP